MTSDTVTTRRPSDSSRTRTGSISPSTAPCSGCAPPTATRYVRPATRWRRSTTRRHGPSGSRTPLRSRLTTAESLPDTTPGKARRPDLPISDARLAVDRCSMLRPCSVSSICWPRPNHPRRAARQRHLSSTGPPAPNPRTPRRSSQAQRLVKRQILTEKNPACSPWSPRPILRNSFRYVGRQS